MDRKTKIVCTIGPASNSQKMIKSLIIAGMNVARLNLSHCTDEEFDLAVTGLKKERERLNKPVAILADTRGPEVRCVKFENGLVELVDDEEVVLEYGDFLGTKNHIPITYKNLYKDISVGCDIFIDDGQLELVVTKIEDKKIYCKVLMGGQLKNKKGINVPGVYLELPILSESDKKDIIKSIKNDLDFVAVSFVRNKQDVLDIRKFLDDNGGEKIQIIAKIENQHGLDNINEIVKEANGIMVARGDLGVEIPAEEIPVIQKKIIKICNHASKPVITATQMLDSMQENPYPTRAELSDIANAVLDGTDAIMLSGETAAGKYPLLALKQMAKSAKCAEKAISKDLMFKRLEEEKSSDITIAVGQAACTTAETIKASSIICPTFSGITLRTLSSFRPMPKIIALTPNKKLRRQLNIFWGVYPLEMERYDSLDVLIFNAIKVSKDNKLIKENDLVVITAGTPLGVAKNTNLMRVKTVR